MKRSPMPRKRTKPRRTTTPRCVRQRCGKREKALGLCQSHLVKEADRLTSKRRREQSPVCAGWASKHFEVGCRGPLQWAHVHSRRYLAIRYEDANAVVLCASHHAYFTHKPLEWEQWCRDRGIPWDELRVRALNDPPMDPAAVIDSLRRTE